jgi:uncharacterized protein (TIGR00251 family)
LRVRLSARANRNSIVAFEDGVLNVRVSAPPVVGAANRALVELLSEALDAGTSRIAIVSGQASRTKQVRVDGMSDDELSSRIAAHLARK